MRRAALLSATLLILPAVALGGFRVSSFKKETRLGENWYNAGSAIDSNMETCWQVDPENENQGQWIEIDIPQGTVDKLGAVVGWAKDEETFIDYARIKKARVQVFDFAKDEQHGELVLDHPVSFEDKQEWQVVDLPDTEVGSELFGGKVRIVVTEVYPGKDYPSLAVSEVLVHLKGDDAITALVEPPDTAAQGHGPDALTDENPKTYWASDGPGAGSTFVVEASGFGLSGLHLYPGPAGYTRPKTVKVQVARMDKTVTLEDSAEVQEIILPAVTGYLGSAWGEVTITVVDTYEARNEALALGEIKLQAATYEGL